jgi:hypothetical protein
MRITAALSLSLALSLTAACESQPKHPPPRSDRSRGSAPAIPENAQPSEKPSAHCRENADCNSNQYCAHDLGLCGVSKQRGVCMPKPSDCGGYDPACGCDGRVYDSACVARSAGVDLSVRGRCKAVVPDFIPCGAHYCDAHRQYCEIYLSDVVDLPTTSHCRPLPEQCLPQTGAQRSCECFPPATPCRSFCGPTWTGGVPGFHLTCQGVREPR